MSTDVHSNDGSLVAVAHEPSGIPKGAHVEIVDPVAGPGDILLPTKVRVNGVDDGLIAEDGVSYERRGWWRRKKVVQAGVAIQAGSWGEPTLVTLTLLASRVEIKGADDS